jgi:hypothetical protein
VRALLACPPLALAAFALSTAALLGERLLAALGRGAAGAPEIPTLVFWIGLASAFGAFWLVGALRLAGLLGSATSRLGAFGAFATAGLGAILAPLELGRPAADALAVALSAACFATFFLLHVPLRLALAQRAGAERSGPT